MFYSPPHGIKISDFWGGGGGEDVSNFDNRAFYKFL